MILEEKQKRTKEFWKKKECQFIISGAVVDWVTKKDLDIQKTKEQIAVLEKNQTNVYDEKGIGDDNEYFKQEITIQKLKNHVFLLKEEIQEKLHFATVFVFGSEFDYFERFKENALSKEMYIFQRSVELFGDYGLDNLI